MARVTGANLRPAGGADVNATRGWGGRGWPPAMNVIRLASLALLGWAVSTEISPGAHGRHLVVWLAVAAMLPAWVGWAVTPERARTRRIVIFCWLGLTAGVLAAYAPAGLGAVAAATLAAAAGFELAIALLVAAAGPAALAVTALIGGGSAALVLGGVAASLAGLVIGFGRRDSAERARQEMRVAIEHEQAELERGRADVLAERNRLAREVHDVLAHTLGALSVQLEALDAQLDAAEEVPGPLRDGLRRTRSLAVDGLADARRAVRALRGDALPLPAQLEKLCELRGARLSVAGGSREVAPEAALALYRAAQEALTNVTKHAPGAAADVCLSYEQDVVSLTVENGAGSRPVGTLAGSGAGYGLEGIRERVRLLRGDVTAGPHGAGWQVEVRVPA